VRVVACTAVDDPPPKLDDWRKLAGRGHERTCSPCSPRRRTSTSEAAVLAKLVLY